MEGNGFSSILTYNNVPSWVVVALILFHTFFVHNPRNEEIEKIKTEILILQGQVVKVNAREKAREMFSNTDEELSEIKASIEKILNILQKKK